MSEPEPPMPWPPVGISTSSGTWDDWLALRSQPTPPAGETGVTLSDADYVAAILSTGHLELVDFGMEVSRNGMRDLFAEFEASTAGQTVLWRKPEAHDSKIELVVVGTDEGLLRVAMTPETGRPLVLDLDVEKAIWLAMRVTSELKRMASDQE